MPKEHLPALRTEMLEASTLRTSTSGPQSIQAQPAHWKISYLVVVVVSLLIGSGLKVFRLFSPSLATSDRFANLDSFSEPSIAAAVLRQYARELMSAHDPSKQIEAQIESQAQTVAGNRSDSRRSKPNERRVPFHAPRDMEGLQVPSIERLQGLQQEIKKLNADVAYELMHVHLANREWNEFLDCYLQLLQTTPNMPDSRYWAHWALVYSQNCGRTDEVLDSLQHVIRFDCHLKSTDGLKTLLDEWTKGPPGR